ncbi:MAG: ABC transporter substrate-binding protein, partial [Thermomicrobiales bacterium]
MRSLDPHAVRLTELRLAAHEQRIDRRSFLARALALGIAAPAAAAMFRTYAAAAPLAQEARKTGEIVVTSGGSASTMSEEDLAGAKSGGTLRFGRLADSNNLDPVTNDGNVNIWILTNIYDTLVRVGLDGASLEPALAESWTMSDDGLVYTFTLRSGVMFSDGTPMTSKDVKFSWVRAANDPNQIWTFTLTALGRDADGQVEGIETPDDATVVVTLPQPWAPFLSDVAMFNMSVVSEAFAGKDEAKLVDQAMGTGPFALKEWKKGESITLVKNPNYWEAGLPYLDQVDVMIVPDDNARVLQLQGGELDAMGDVPSSRLAELGADANLKVLAFPSTFSQYVTINNREAPLDDVHARRALQYATDKQTLIDVVLFGQGEVATTFMPKGSLFWNETLEGFPYDVEKAKAELAQSKTPDGFAFELQTVAGSDDQTMLATALKDMWSQIGVDVTIAPTESGVVNDNYNAHSFQAMINSWTNDIIDPDELVSYAILPESSEAFQTGWTDVEAVDLARKGAGEPDDAKRKEIYYRIQEIYNEQSPMILLYHKPYLVVTTSNVHNMQQPPTGQWVWGRT